LEKKKKNSCDPEVKWSPVLSGAGYFTVGMIDIKMNGKTIPSPQFGPIKKRGAAVDSGSTNLALQSDIFDSLRISFLENCKGCPDVWDRKVISISEKVLKSFPNIEFDLEDDVKLILPPTMYMIGLGQNNYYLGISSLPSGININIFGDTLMQAFHVVFDREYNRVGFAPLTHCPKVGDPTSGLDCPKKSSTSSNDGNSLINGYELITLIAFYVLFSIYWQMI